MPSTSIAAMPGSLRRSLARLSLARLDLDRWTVVYLVASAFYPLLKPSVMPHPYARAAAHLGLAAAVWILPPLARRSRFYAVRLAGEIYLPFIFPFLYSELAQLGIVFYGFHDSLDPWFVHLEQSIFGTQPSLVWSRVWPWPWLHELFEFAYFSYYFMPLLTLVLILRARGIPRLDRWPAMRAFIRDQGATMLIAYSLYTFFPVWGPKYFQAGPVRVDGWVFTRIMEQIHARGAILGAAFPSSHVAGTLVPLYHVWKWFPRHRWWMATLFVLLCAATVYCRYHYVVDIMGGLLLGGLVVWLGERFGERTIRRPERED